MNAIERSMYEYAAFPRPSFRLRLCSHSRPVLCAALSRAVPEQVYAHYRPVAKRPAAVTRKGSERLLSLQTDGDPGKEGAEAMTVRERLSITCRLVKDFQQEIQLFARYVVLLCSKQ